MRIRRSGLITVFVFSHFLSCAQAAAITLSQCNDWIEQCKRWVTVDGAFSIKRASARMCRIGASSLSGSSNVAGTGDTTGLPMGAFITHAACFSDALLVDLDTERAHQSGGDATILITGFWRLWFEQQRSHNQNQFGVNGVGGPALNPEHVFENYPLSSPGSFDLTNPPMPLRDERDQLNHNDADKVFSVHRCKEFSIPSGLTTTTLASERISSNYFRFLGSRLDNNLDEVASGVFLYVTVVAPVGYELERANANLQRKPGWRPGECDCGPGVSPSYHQLRKHNTIVTASLVTVKGHYQLVLGQSDRFPHVTPRKTWRVCILEVGFSRGNTKC